MILMPFSKKSIPKVFLGSKLKASVPIVPSKNATKHKLIFKTMFFPQAKITVTTVKTHSQKTSTGVKTKESCETKGPAKNTKIEVMMPAINEETAAVRIAS